MCVLLFSDALPHQGGTALIPLRIGLGLPRQHQIIGLTFDEQPIQIGLVQIQEPFFRRQTHLGLEGAEFGGGEHTALLQNSVSAEQFVLGTKIGELMLPCLLL